MSAREQPDTIWTTDATGKRLYGRPNYDKPGVFERVQQDAFEAEMAARPAGGGLSLLIRMKRLNDFYSKQRGSSCR